MLNNNEIIVMYNEWKKRMSENDAIIKLFMLGYEQGSGHTYNQMRKLNCPVDKYVSGWSEMFFEKIKDRIS